MTPLHLEFLDSWEAFEAVLEVRFRQLPGHRKIKQREYALRNNALQRDVEKSLAFTRCFLPGKRIDMSMVFDGSIGGRSSCPGCQLVTSKTEEGLDSQVQCPRCKICYQRVVETSTTESKQRSTIVPRVIMQENMSAAPHSQKRQRNHEEELDENPAHFRRVRLRYSDQNDEPGSQAAQETDISPTGSSKKSRNKAASTQAESVGTPVQMTGVIASTSTDSASVFYADDERTVPDVAASTSASKSPAAKDEVFFTYSSALEEDLRHPIGGSYIPNAQLVYGSDGETDILLAEKPDWYDRTVFGSPPAEDDEHDRSSFFYSDLYLGEDHAAPAASLKLQSSIFSASLPHVATSQRINDKPDHNKTREMSPWSNGGCVLRSSRDFDHECM